MMNEIEFNEMLTKDEFFKLAQATRKLDGQIDESEVEKLVNWSVKARANASCVDLIVGGFLTVDGFDSEGNPLLMPPDDVIEFFGGLETPMFEESRC